MASQQLKSRGKLGRPKEIKKKLKGADPELSAYVDELEKKNLMLQKLVAKLQVIIVSKDNEIKALKKAQPKYKIVLQEHAPLKKDKERHAL